MLLCCSGQLFASPIRAVDVGVLGLASHDLFQWDSETDQNLENGRFDLSTIFDYAGGSRIAQGGNPKNSENAPVFTVTQHLVDFYLGHKQTLLYTGRYSEVEAYTEARQATVAHFIAMIDTSYRRMMNKAMFNTGLNDTVNHQEQAAMRALHDVLPGELTLKQNFSIASLAVTDYMQAQVSLSTEEQIQTIAFYDGEYDPAYHHIFIPHFPEPYWVDLEQVDREFIDHQAGMDLDNMLWELKVYQFFYPAANLIDFTRFGHHLETLFSKGICHINQDQTNNTWISDSIDCI